jgi:large subunit ribosomal protein L18
MKNNNLKSEFKRKRRIRAKLKKTSDRNRLSVFRSLRHIYAQIIDDQKGKTLVSVSDHELKQENNNKVDMDKKDFGIMTEKFKQAYLVGQRLAAKAKKKKITTVYFDRGKYKFHGRVKALAQGARSGGLKF